MMRASVSAASPVLAAFLFMWLPALPAFSEMRGGVAALESSATIRAKGELRPGVIVRVTLPGAIKPSKLRAGDCLEGWLGRPVYSYDREVIPAGSGVRLTVDRVERKKAGGEERKAFFARSVVHFRNLFVRNENPAISFGSAIVVLPNGAEVPVNVSLIEVAERVPIRVKGERVHPDVDGSRAPSGDGNALPVDTGSLERLESAALPRGEARQTMVILRLEQAANFPLPIEKPPALPVSRNETVTLGAGTRARLLVIPALSASRNHAGDVFQARLVEPIYVGEQRVLPEGSVFGGRVTRRKPPRRFGRGGSLRLSFDRLALPSGRETDVSTSLVGVEADRKVPLKIDSEGTLEGGRRGKVATVVGVGAAYLVGKVADDLLEEGVKFGVGAAASGTATVVARYVGIGTGLLFFFAQRGKDARLPQYTELEVTFDRPVVVFWR